MIIGFIYDGVNVSVERDSSGNFCGCIGIIKDKLLINSNYNWAPLYLGPVRG